MTDNAWATFLASRPEITEANFWSPSSATAFRALQPGEPFLFKTHRPHDRLVGGGFFSGHAALRVSEAWRTMGQGNGVSSHDELLAAIHRYRKDTSDPDPVIGCLLLRDVFFVPEALTLDAPPDFAANIVRFKGYDLSSNSYLERALASLLASAGPRLTLPTEELAQLVPGATRGAERTVDPRVGQQAFKGLLLSSYGRRCAITGSRIEPVLEAAHIRPVAQDGQHRLDNGMLLRADVHRMFDAGYLGVDEKHHLRVSHRLREDFGNGVEFYSREGRELEVVPSRRVDRPAKEFLTWHMDVVFKSA